MYPTTGTDTSATRLSIAQRLDPELVKNLFAAALCLGGFIVTTIGFTTESVTPAMYIGPLMLAACFVVCLVRCVQWHSDTPISGGTTQNVGRTVTAVPAGQVVTARPAPAVSTSQRPNMAAPAPAQTWSYPSYSRFSLMTRPTEQVPYPPAVVLPSPTSPSAPSHVHTVLPPYTPAAWTGDEPPPSYDEATKQYSEK
ncbi:PREDICTED: uncharacterized protein LOC109486482 [Branchiostoma belcheri]|uniref:Uncharacterized protein LOC109486482 n=1 Tax=Branchiostoma belcheri TaxID=7741 RepID=A0A6P5AHT3_BRABE|nr:PREDICTED: uncharacterized protein LOC109486482 [Branchiostoma belcheri]